MVQFFLPHSVYVCAFMNNVALRKSATWVQNLYMPDATEQDCGVYYTVWKHLLYT